MKTLFASLVAIFLAFFIGCQESSITDPVSNDTGWNLGTSDKDIINNYPGAIKLDGMLSDPSNPSNTINNTVKISVADTGPGIPRPALKRVFDDFYRVDSSQTSATGGSGIGLAIVKKFVVAMGGSVTAANNDGPGCTITISLPS